MPDKFFYICDAKRKILDGKCPGTCCKYLKSGDCELTSNSKYAKNEFNRDHFFFVYHQERGDIDYYSELEVVPNERKKKNERE